MGSSERPVLLRTHCPTLFMFSIPVPQNSIQFSPRILILTFSLPVIQEVNEPSLTVSLTSDQSFASTQTYRAVQVFKSH